MLRGAISFGEPSNGESAVSAFLNEPNDMAFDAAGTLYYSSTNSKLVRSISPAGVLGTKAGNGYPGIPAYGPALESPLSPSEVDFDASGNLLITNDVGALVTVSPGGTLSLVPSNASPLSGTLTGVAAAPGGVVYALDVRTAACGMTTCDAPRIRKVASNGSVSTVYAPTPVGYEPGLDLAYSPPKATSSTALPMASRA